MPLLDHFHPPLSRRRHWENLHSAWANALRQQLNDELLPPRYFAEVSVRLGGRFEIDVATLDEEPGSEARGIEAGGVAVRSLSRPTGAITSGFAGSDLFEVRVFNDEEGPRVVAAVELVSPANKDRPNHRQAFAIKCGSYLLEGIGLVVADVVTERSGNLHADLLDLIGQAAGPADSSATGLYAVAYRPAAATEDDPIDYWFECLALGAALPTVPLWIAPDLYITLDLERAYAAACASSRIG